MDGAGQAETGTSLWRCSSRAANPGRPQSHRKAEPEPSSGGG